LLSPSQQEAGNCPALLSRRPSPVTTQTLDKKAKNEIMLQCSPQSGRRKTMSRRRSGSVLILAAMTALILLTCACDETSSQTSSASADWKILDVQSKITAKDASGTTFGWKVTIRNDDSSPRKFVGQVHFLDKDGFEIRSDYFNLIDSELVAAHSEHTFTGSTFFYEQQNPQSVVKVTASARRD
jgi:hypothetical protein